MGVAALPLDARDGTALVRAADQALYRAKDRGRDRIETAAGPRVVDLEAVDRRRRDASLGR
jgi:predicted signal transduction protein with EAL and GGDEF domain